MFEDLDFSVLDDPSFKEDAVREEIIAPILKRLGYLGAPSRYRTPSDSEGMLKSMYLSIL